VRDRQAGTRALGYFARTARAEPTANQPGDRLAQRLVGVPGYRRRLGMKIIREVNGGAHAISISSSHHDAKMPPSVGASGLTGALADGHELTFQVNHLAPFLLTMLLREQLSAAGASVITTSSRAGTVRDARVDPDDLDMVGGYDGLRAYKSSKLANVLFTRELARRWGPLGISTAAVHPGMVRSQWGKSGPMAVRAVVNSPLRLAMRSPERGADTIVWLATTTPGKDWLTGGYFANCKPATPPLPRAGSLMTRTSPNGYGTSRQPCAACSEQQSPDLLSKVSCTPETRARPMQRAGICGYAEARIFSRVTGDAIPGTSYFGCAGRVLHGRSLVGNPFTGAPDQASLVLHVEALIHRRDSATLVVKGHQ
jgi:NAD(P)-dependent dehydrogenase (short-subunit alcohol dehydrogenase family)